MKAENENNHVYVKMMRKEIRGVKNCYHATKMEKLKHSYTVQVIHSQTMLS